MPDRAEPTVVAAGERRTATGLPSGSSGHEAFADATGWVGFISLPPGAMSQWHHHGEWTSYAVVYRGVLRWEFGVGGGEAIVVEPGATGRMPAHRIHRDVSAGGEPLEMTLFRTGQGPLTISVDGPEEAART
jgi:uncharacterized RmlC-like cupin family protein